MSNHVLFTRRPDDTDRTRNIANLPDAIDAPLKLLSRNPLTRRQCPYLPILHQRHRMYSIL